MRTIEWDATLCQLKMIDQRLLPGRFEVVSLTDYHEVAAAIRIMVVRGAPAIGASAAFGMALAACRSKASNLTEIRAELYQAAETLKASRPTAVNLSWAVQQMLVMVDLPPSSGGAASVEAMRDMLVNEAQRIAD